MTLQPEIYAQTSQIFEGRVTLLRVISYIQGVVGVVTGLGILLCAISAVVNPTIHKYITLYAAVFLCGLPGSAVLIGSFLLHQRLRSQVYKDDFKLYVRLYIRLCVLSLLLSMAMMVVGGIHLNKGISVEGEKTPAYTASLICMTSGLVQFFTSLPVAGTALRARQYMP